MAEHQQQTSSTASSSGTEVQQGGAAASSADPGRERPEPCTPYFDALWFCYSPVHQMRQYYVYGTVDDCRGHWSELYNCLKKRTKFKDEVPEDPNKGKHPLWELRTSEEARAFWAEEFGHLGGASPAAEALAAQQQQQQQQQQQPGGRPRAAPHAEEVGPEERRHAGKATLV